MNLEPCMSCCTSVSPAGRKHPDLQGSVSSFSSKYSYVCVCVCVCVQGGGVNVYYMCVCMIPSLNGFNGRDSLVFGKQFQKFWWFSSSFASSQTNEVKWCPHLEKYCVCVFMFMLVNSFMSLGRVLTNLK